MERYLKIAKVNLKFNLFPHIIVAVFLCLISPFIMGVENLNYSDTAKILDVYISLVGIILLVPLFFLEIDNDIRDLVRTKKESTLLLYIIWVMESISLIFIIVCGFLIYLKSGNCTFPFWKYFYGTISTCIFLGGMGVLVHAVIDNLAVAYMIPTLYYILCYGSGDKYLGKVYLFSMMKGNVEDKIYLLVLGVIMILASILLRNRRIFIK